MKKLKTIAEYVSYFLLGIGGGIMIGGGSWVIYDLFHPNK